MVRHPSLRKCSAVSICKSVIELFKPAADIRCRLFVFLNNINKPTGRVVFYSYDQSLQQHGSRLSLAKLTVDRFFHNSINSLW